MEDEKAPGPGLADLDDDAWLTALDAIAEDRGYFEPLGALHSAVFTDRGPQLLVTFETVATIRASQTHLPLGFTYSDLHGWSHLGLIAREPTWFRDDRVYRYIDRLIDDGFFEDFDQVLFYGAGMGGYAAAAFSVASPGATVIALAPQATLDTGLAGWDRRFPLARRFDFTGRYAYAPDMIEAAAGAYVLYDPRIEADAIHAGHFHAGHVSRLALSHIGDDPQAELLRTGFLPGLLVRAMKGGLDTGTILRAWRRVRRSDQQLLRAVIREIEATGNTWRLAKAARFVAERTNARRFRRIAVRATQALEAEGRRLPARKRSPASKAAE
jgi:hypothetical protein